MKTKERGITLIALVVTIIVLLILAGVSIQMLTGQSGILNQAKEAKDSTKRAEIVENIQEEIIEKSMEKGGEDPSQQDLYDILNKYFEGVPEVKENVWNAYPEGFPNESGKLKTRKEYGGYEIEVKEIYEGRARNNKPGKPDKDGIFTENSTIDGTKGSYDNPTIPAGFKPVNPKEDSSVGEAIWENVEDTVNKGLVIEDGEKNQFVWVPVPAVTIVGTSIEGTNIDLSDKSAETPMAEFVDGNYRGVLYNYMGMTDELKSIQIMNYDETQYREPDVLIKHDETDNDPIKLQKQNLQKDYNEMIKCVEKYGGFYIARYEMSLSSDGKAQYKKGEISAVSTVDSANNWYGFYEKQKNFSKDTNIISSMVWGSQYDAMMNWMAKCGVNVNTFTIEGKHRNETRRTGLGNDGLDNSTDILNNIYDLLGNKREWTMEAYSDGVRVARGGYETYDSPLTSRSGSYGGSNPNVINNQHGSRASIYIL